MSSSPQKVTPRQLLPMSATRPGTVFKRSMAPPPKQKHQK